MELAKAVPTKAKSPDQCLPIQVNTSLVSPFPFLISNHLLMTLMTSSSVHFCPNPFPPATPGEVERRMRSSVRQQVILGMAAYTQTARKQWVREWPAMVVLAVSAIFWSKEVEEAITSEWRPRGLCHVPVYCDVRWKVQSERSSFPLGELQLIKNQTADSFTGLN